jgi:cytochrome c oxidase assembly protein subunit 15
MFKKLAYFNVALAFLIILWGAWVRISGSGDGCGEHWPLCKGEFWPSVLSIETWIEILHRLKSGIFGLTVLWMFLIAKKNHPSRLAALLVLIFTITEALLGAKLVLFGLVGEDDSVHRAVTSALHLCNTSFLMASLVACIAWADGERGKVSREFYIYFLMFLVLGATGAWASLSNTLFPSESLAQGLAQDFSTESHWLVNLRVIHPLLAVVLGAFLSIALYRRGNKFSSTPVRLWIQYSAPTTMAIGLITLGLLSPTWLKLTHLALSTNTVCALVFCFLTLENQRNRSSSLSSLLGQEVS